MGIICPPGMASLAESTAVRQQRSIRPVQLGWLQCSALPPWRLQVTPDQLPYALIGWIGEWRCALRHGEVARWRGVELLSAAPLLLGSRCPAALPCLAR